MNTLERISTRWSRIWGSLCFLFLLSTFTPRLSWAGNKLINVQGLLTNSSGTPLTGTYAITFRLYANFSDPVGSAIWTENQSVTVSSGNFNVSLGSVTALNSIQFNAPYYLGIQVAGDANELSPRQTLGASAYAQGSLANFDIGGGVTVSSNATVSGTVTVSSNVTVSGNMSVTGPVAISSNATVSGSLTVSNNVLVNGNISFSPTTHGIVGTPTDDDAPAGNVGEFVQSAVVWPSTVSYNGANVLTDITSIYLSSGDWDVSGMVIYVQNTATGNLNNGSNYYDSGISSCAGNCWTGLNYGTTIAENSTAGAVTTGVILATTIPPLRVSLSSGTTEYLKSETYYTGGQPTCLGRIAARRSR